MFDLVLTSKKVLVDDRCTFCRFCFCRFYVYIIGSDGIKRFYHSYSQLSHSRLCVLKKLNRLSSNFPGVKFSFSIDIERKTSFDAEPCIIYHYELFENSEV